MSQFLLFFWGLLNIFYVPCEPRYLPNCPWKKYPHHIYAPVSVLMNFETVQNLFFSNSFNQFPPLEKYDFLCALFL